jgi:hypothetical protein
MVKKVIITQKKNEGYNIELKGFTKRDSILAMCNSIMCLVDEIQKQIDQKTHVRPEPKPLTQASLFIEE